MITALSEEPVAFVVRDMHFITVQHLGCVYSYRFASVVVIGVFVLYGYKGRKFV